MKIFVFFTLIISISASFADIPLRSWQYTGGDQTPGGVVGVLNLADVSYTDDDFIHMAAQYGNSPAPLTFQWSSLTVDSSGNILPDPVTGYDGNIAYVSMDFSPATWDGYSLNFNEFDEPCSDISNLNNWESPSTEKCEPPRNPATGKSPNIAYSVIYLNTNGASPLTPDVNKRRFLLMHETGHTLGLGHSTICNTAPDTSPSVMANDSNPNVCNGVPTTLQTEDNNALTLRY